MPARGRCGRRPRGRACFVEFPPRLLPASLGGVAKQCACPVSCWSWSPCSGSSARSPLGSGIIRTLHQFPVVGASFNPASHHAVHGSGLGLVIGLIGLLYGAQGVTQTAQQAMATVWNIPQIQRTGFLPRLGRSLAALLTIGGAFVINAFVTAYATGGT